LPDPFEWIDLFLAIDVRSNDEQKYFCDRVWVQINKFLRSATAQATSSEAAGGKDSRVDPIYWVVSQRSFTQPLIAQHSHLHPPDLRAQWLQGHREIDWKRSAARQAAAPAAARAPRTAAAPPTDGVRQVALHAWLFMSADRYFAAQDCKTVSNSDFQFCLFRGVDHRLRGPEVWSWTLFYRYFYFDTEQSSLI
jgi:hypothetical protein